ncbi:type I phosphomannose isomerase catalytic subunit [Salegentibacter sp. HM20]
MINYPLKFEPILKEKIWGGSKLVDILNKKSDKKNLGESWEISGVADNISIVKNGKLTGNSLNQIIREYKSDFLGKKVFEDFGEEFPLLIKFIDAKTELSVQLHPNDQLARERHNSFGKTEMWYVMQADKGAELNLGFKQSISKQTYIDHLKNSTLIKLLNFEKVSEGDAFFINTGKVHAIGAGVLLAEIQQTSDVTYRIYDWDRVDSNGEERELHTDLAIDAIDFEKKSDYILNYEKVLNKPSNIAHCEYFTTNFLPVKGELTRDYSNIDSFVILMCVEGSAEVEVNKQVESIHQGETVLIPAINSNVKLKANNAKLLEIYID